MTKDILEFQGFALSVADNLLTGPCIVFSWRMVDNGVLFGLFKTLPFPGNHMQEYGTVNMLESFENLSEMHYIVSVNRTEIAYSKGFEDIGIAESDGLGNLG